MGDGVLISLGSSHVPTYDVNKINTFISLTCTENIFGSNTKTMTDRLVTYRVTVKYMKHVLHTL